MKHLELRAVQSLLVADLLEISDDVRVFRVMRIDGGGGAPEAKRKLYVRSLDGSTQLTLVRTGREQVRVVVGH